MNLDYVLYTIIYEKFNSKVQWSDTYTPLFEIWGNAPDASYHLLATREVDRQMLEWAHLLIYEFGG